MVSRRRTDSEEPSNRRRPPTTPEGNENHLVALAFQAVERRIEEGTASAQELVHFLKLGSTREKLEQQKLAHENELLQVKAENYASQSRMEEKYTEAIAAMRAYSGQDSMDHADEYDG
jgi:hypothetical protein